MNHRIKVAICSTCGEEGSCAPDANDDLVCRVCDPDNWELASELDKQAWFNGSFDDVLEANG